MRATPFHMRPLMPTLVRIEPDSSRLRASFRAQDAALLRLVGGGWGLLLGIVLLCA